MSRVTVVVPQWNRRDLLVSLLKHLQRQSYPIQEVLIVDNGSDDGSPEAAANAGARVLQMGTNAGFSRAVNRGLRECRTELAAIVNNDVEPSENWLERLVHALENPEDGRRPWFATGKLLSADRMDRIDGTFDTLCRGCCAWRAGHGRPDGPRWARPRTIRFAPLTAALFRTEVFDRVGYLDESFDTYLEDVDLGLRCGLEGMSGVYVPEAVAAHIGSATWGAWNGSTVRRIARNQLLLVAKHYPPGWIQRYGWQVLVAQSLWGLLALRHGAGWSWLRGKLEAVRMYGSVRGPACGNPARLEELLAESEREIRELQSETGFDWYWRMYFSLT